jgi:cytochrome c peroxidase
VKTHPKFVFIVLSFVFLGGVISCRTALPQQSLDVELRNLLKNSGIAYSSLAPGPPASEAKIALGEALFFDKELSGNRDVSCATCHHPLLHTSDGLALPIGVGGHGLGAARQMGAGREFVPRNSPDIFNRGAPEWATMFWDGRISGSPEMGFSNPAGGMLPHGLDNILAAQAMFPVTSADEMRGKTEDVTGFENELAIFSDDDPTAIWQALMTRLLVIPEYVSLFRSAYPYVSRDDLGFEHAANAIAAYEANTWTMVDSPWDQYLSGDDSAISNAAKRGALLFYGGARCGQCHSTNLFTDQGYHNIGVPQLGPGKGDEKPLDYGRWLVTSNADDRFAFRTPPLRNVALTAPYMHNGAYADLESVVRHHLNPTEALQNYNPEHLLPELQETCIIDDATIQAILENLDPLVRTPIELSDSQVADLITFLQALTSPSAVDLSANIPATVPSGLPVKD